MWHSSTSTIHKSPAKLSNTLLHLLTINDSRVKMTLLKNVKRNCFLNNPFDGNKLDAYRHQHFLFQLHFHELETESQMRPTCWALFAQYWFIKK